MSIREHTLCAYSERRLSTTRHSCVTVLLMKISRCSAQRIVVMRCINVLTAQRLRTSNPSSCPGQRFVMERRLSDGHCVEHGWQQQDIRSAYGTRKTRLWFKGNFTQKRVRAKSETSRRDLGCWCPSTDGRKPIHNLKWYNTVTADSSTARSIAKTFSTFWTVMVYSRNWYFFFLVIWK